MFVKDYKGVNIHLSIDQDSESARFEFMYDGLAYSHASYEDAKNMINSLQSNDKVILVFNRWRRPIIRVVVGHHLRGSFRYIDNGTWRMVNYLEADVIPYSDTRLSRIKKMKEQSDALYKRQEEENKNMNKRWVNLIDSLKEEVETHDKSR